MISFKVRVHNTDNFLVIKKLIKNAITLNLFLHEIHTLTNLNHPNITKITEYFETKYSYVIVYPYFEGLPILNFL